MDSRQTAPSKTNNIGNGGKSQQIEDDTEDEKTHPQSKKPLKSHIGKPKSESESDSAPPPRSKITSKVGGRKPIQSKIGKEKSMAEEDSAPHGKGIKSKMGKSNKSRESTPEEQEQLMEKSQVVEKELSAEEKALEKREKLEREREERKGKRVEKNRRF